jgi:hypothetical protein
MMENTNEENQSQPCPHCGDKSGSCTHVKSDHVAETDDEEEEDDDCDDDDEMEDSDVPECPYCHADENDFRYGCPHLLLDYDLTFNEYQSGYLVKHPQELDELQSEILKLLQAGAKPKTNDSQILSLWETAEASYEPGNTEIDFDDSVYLQLLEDVIYMYEGEAFRYEGVDGAPGYSSAYIIYYSEDPQTTLEELNDYIIDELKGKD